MSESAALAAIKARVLSKKRKREQDDEEPASERSVRFSDVVQEKTIPASPTAAPASKPKSKTKQKYLKKRRVQYKANLKLRAKGGEGQKDDQEPQVMDDAAVSLTAEEEDAARRARKERKARLKAERRLPKEQRTQEEEHVADNSIAEIDVNSEGTASTGQDSKSTKRRRSVHFDDAPILTELPVEAVEAEEPAEPMLDIEGLQRLPRPRRLEAPDLDTLRGLGIAEELRDGVIIEPSLTIERDALTSKATGEPLLDRNLRHRLAAADITNFFAVQAAVLPLLLESPQLYPDSPLPDLCVSAPTGSGKTLAYALPVVETLSARIVTRLGALVVLPTRDLAQQVREVFDMLCKGTDLQIGLATGQHSLAKEQESLVGASELVTGGSSNIDILIATPGRLLEHLRSTPNFTLQHLRFFVIDEADRLIGQSFGDWLPTVLARLEDCSASEGAPTPVAPHMLASLVTAPRTLLDRPVLPAVQKLLFSATLSRDPTQIAGLRLHRPIYVAVREAGAAEDVDEAFALPATLKEHMVTSAPANKPLLLFHLLLTKRVGKALCFTKSIEAAMRLTKLLELFNAEQQKADPASSAIKAASYASDLPLGKRNKLLEAFRNGEIQLLVCSDLIARGMDIANVDHVISYDVPVDIRKYIHRVGRTARAGRTGEAWSLVEKQEVAHFKEMLAKAGRADKIELVRLKKADYQKLEPAYEAARVSMVEHFSRS